MNTKHTGGQYSLLRFLLGAYLAALFGSLLFKADRPENIIILLLVAVIPALAGIAFALGAKDWVAAIVCGWMIGVARGGIDPMQTEPIFILPLLVFHLFVRSAPYGSWTARGRVNPRGSWRMPSWLFRGFWLGLAALYAAAALVLLYSQDSGARWAAVVPITFVVFALKKRTRTVIWILFTFISVVLTVLYPSDTGYGAFLLLHLFAFDPAWVPPVQRSSISTVFYDGTCGLCHRTIRFLLAEDLYENLNFAPLQGATFETRRGALAASSFPDSIVVFAESGEPLFRSAAVIEALLRLGGVWRVLGTVGSWLPSALLDWIYDRIAAIRQRVFTKPEALCPLLPPDLAGRFLS